MKRRILCRPWAWLLLVALAFFVVDRLAGWALGKVAETSQHRFSRVYRASPEPCLLVLGHSRGVQVISPEGAREVTGLPLYNLSANGMSTEIAEALFLDYLDAGGKPSGLVIEVTSICSNNGLVRDLKMFAGRSRRIHDILEKDEPTLAVTSDLFHSFRYNSDLMSRMIYHWSRDDQGLTNFFVAKPDFLAQSPIEAADWQVQKSNLGALVRMLARAKEEGVPVRLVVGPFWQPAEVDAMVSERVIEAVGTVTDQKVWDYSASLADHRFFADHVHLNAAGTAALHRIMLESGFFGPWQSSKAPGNPQ